MIEPPYESRAKRRRVVRSVFTLSGFIRRGGKIRMSKKVMEFGYGRFFNVNRRSYNEKTRYAHSHRWRKKHGKGKPVYRWRW